MANQNVRIDPVKALALLSQMQTLTAAVLSLQQRLELQAAPPKKKVQIEPCPSSALDPLRWERNGPLRATDLGHRDPPSRFSSEIPTFASHIPEPKHDDPPKPQPSQSSPRCQASLANENHSSIYRAIPQSIHVNPSPLSTEPLSTVQSAVQSSTEPQNQRTTVSTSPQSTNRITACSPQDHRTTEPQPTDHQSIVHHSTEPQSSKPNPRSIPQSTVPQSTVPQSTVPQSTVQQSTSTPPSSPTAFPVSHSLNMKEHSGRCESRVTETKYLGLVIYYLLRLNWKHRYIEDFMS
ncbi:hypothetical protein V8E54_000510 [Elaphomyces granulatus]